MGQPRTAGRAAMALAAALFVVATPVRASVTDVYYERALMTAADARCGLFSADTSAALGAAMYQARGAALRSGLDEAGVGALASRAQSKAAAIACNARDLQLAAERVRLAFKGYARLQRMSFPGDARLWRADRVLPAKAPAWRLYQTTDVKGEALTFGIAGRIGSPQQLLAVADLGSEETPYTARLVMRDAARSQRPYLPAATPLQAKTPPRWASRVFAAEARGPADASLTPVGAEDAIAFRFPAAAAQAMSGLDPREAVIVEFVYAGRSGDVVRQAFIEVGDFAAGRAFLTAAAR